MRYGGKHQILGIATSPGLAKRSKSRKNGIEKVKHFISNLKGELIIIDPYFYTPARNQEIDDYIQEIENVLLFFQNVKRVHVIYNKDNTDQIVRHEFKQIETRYDCKLTDTHTNLIHDRVWLGDRRTARLVGSSFNGIGRGKISFMVSLPSKDVTDLQYFLQENNLLPDDMQLIQKIKKK